MRRIEEVKNEVLSRIKPTPEEERLLSERAEEIVSTLEGLIQKLGYDAKVEVLGSFAKGTRIRGKKELDVFILVPPPEGITRKNYIPYFERLVKGLIEIIPWKYELRYANHPYIRVHLDDISADVVPGFMIDDPSNIISPVDRSPFHARYVMEHLDEKGKDEVRLLKQFLKGLRAYGAEIKVQGLPGYACELLIISEGSFEGALKAIRRLKFVDTAGHYDFKRPLSEQLDKGLRNILNDSVMIIVDPVDPKRNVAAALSWETYAKLTAGINMFFDNPSTEFFFTPEPPRGKPKDNMMVLFGPTEGLSEDIIWGKLWRLVRIIRKAVKEDPNLSFYVTDIYPGTYKERRYVVVKFLEGYLTRGKTRGPKVSSTRGIYRFLNKMKEARIEGPIDISDISKNIIKGKEPWNSLYEKPLAEVRRIIKKSRLSEVEKYHFMAVSEMKYPDPREALRHKIKGGLPVKNVKMWPMENIPKDLLIDYGGRMRPLNYLAQIVSGSS